MRLTKETAWSRQGARISPRDPRNALHHAQRVLHKFHLKVLTVRHWPSKTEQTDAGSMLNACARSCSQLSNMGR